MKYRYSIDIVEKGWGGGNKGIREHISLYLETYISIKNKRIKKNKKDATY